MASKKRSLSPVPILDIQSSAKRQRQEECFDESGMDVDTVTADDHPLAPPSWHITGPTDGNEWVGQALELDSNAYTGPACSPVNGPTDTKMDASVPQTSYSYPLGGHYGYVAPTAQSAESHPLRTAISVDTLSSATASTDSTAPQTPADELLDFDDQYYDEDAEQPCYAFAAYGKTSLPFFRLGHA